VNAIPVVTQSKPRLIVLHALLTGRTLRAPGRGGGREGVLRQLVVSSLLRPNVGFTEGRLTNRRERKERKVKIKIINSIRRKYQKY
jgi:hypothetical protein